MTYVGAIVLGLVVHGGTRQFLTSRMAGALAATVTMVAAAPPSILLAACAWVGVLVGLRRRQIKGVDRRANPDEVGQVLSIALSAGMPVAAALQFTADEVDAPVAAEIRSVLRNARSRGLAAALTEADGSAGRLFGVLARTQVTGSSAMNAVAALLDDDRKRRRTAAREAAQRLPVKLTIPLALLILPGFVLLTMGPTVIATVQRLLGPLVP